MSVTRYRFFFAATIVLLLSGCSGDMARRPSPASFDFAVPRPTPDAVPPPRLSLRQIEVQAPPWLELPTMQYILAYADASITARRAAYAESRWVAPPARLLEKSLVRDLLSTKSEIPSTGCRLHIELDEFVQVYDAPEHSRALIEVRAMLMAPRANVTLLRQSFRQSPVAGVGARAGVLAMTDATHKLGAQIALWLKQMADATPALIDRCRTG